VLNSAATTSQCRPFPRRATLAFATLVALATIMVGGIDVSSASGAPGVGVYRGEGRADRVARFERWLGADVTYAVDFLKNVGWRPEDAFVGPWRRSNYRLSLAVPLEPHPPSDWKQLARRLKPGTLIRLGWEMNGTWFPWSGDPRAYVRGWRRAVTYMRQANPRLRFEWAPVAGSGDPVPYYPGDRFVDVIGLDVYNTQTWWRMRKHQWGTNWHIAFAKQHGKRISFPEWGLVMPENGGQGDNPIFVRKMIEWATKHNAVYQAYFEFDAPDGLGLHELRHYPRSERVFKRQLRKLERGG
jgi:hypothetical protein